MTEICWKRDTCRLCGSADMEIAVPLAPMPIATPNMGLKLSAETREAFTRAVPLDVMLCTACGQLQVGYVGNPEIQYRDYVYTTSISLGLSEHFMVYAQEVIDALMPRAGGNVVEFGSNDGTLLRAFKAKGFNVLGIDPAKVIAERATENGIETWAEFFSADIAHKIIAEKGAADLIISNNVLANIDNLDPVAEGIKQLLAPGGAWIFETQYGADVFERNLLDTVYHEHLTYFNVRPLMLFLDRHGLEMMDAKRIETKGGSIRVTVQHKNGPRPITARVGELSQWEQEKGMGGLAYYASFKARVDAIADELTAIADAVHAKGGKVAGYGVSVGTTALMPQFRLTQKIDMLFDDDPQRDGHLLGPDYEIPIYQGRDMMHHKPDVIIVFAWRYTDPIMKKQAEYIAAGGQFVVPLPDVRTRP